MKKLIMLALMLVASSAAHAESTTITSLANHGNSCGAYLQQQGSDDVSTVTRLALLSWVSGFLTGANLQTFRDAGVDILEHLDRASLEPWVDNYCRTHALDNLFDAASALTKELRAKKGLTQ